VPGQHFKTRGGEKFDDVIFGFPPNVVDKVDEDGPVLIGPLTKKFDFVKQVFKKCARLQEYMTQACKGLKSILKLQLGIIKTKLSSELLKATIYQSPNQMV
jgi:hypothetical protein